MGGSELGWCWTRRFLDRFFFTFCLRPGDILDSKQVVNRVRVVVEMRKMLLPERRKEERVGEG